MVGSSLARVQVSAVIRPKAGSRAARGLNRGGNING